MSKHEYFDSILEDWSQLSCNSSMRIKLKSVSTPFYCPLCGEEVTENTNL